MMPTIASAPVGIATVVLHFWIPGILRPFLVINGVSTAARYAPWPWRYSSNFVLRVSSNVPKIAMGSQRFSARKRSQLARWRSTQKQVLATRFIVLQPPVSKSLRM